jgi:rhodanese-related sulfurtransferase
MYEHKSDRPLGLMDFVKAAKSVIHEVNAEQLKAKLDSGEDLLLLDVRESSEHEQGHISGSMLIPRGILEAAADPGYPKHVPALVNARERQVVLYCATGGRSAMGAAVLQMMGFTNVASLAGGYGAWEQAGMPVVKEARYV